MISNHEKFILALCCYETDLMQDDFYTILNPQLSPKPYRLLNDKFFQGSSTFWSLCTHSNEWLYYCVCVCQRVCWIRTGRNLFCLSYRLLNIAWVPLGMSFRPCNFATCEVFNLHKTRVMININKIFSGCECPRGSIF